MRAFLKAGADALSLHFDSGRLTEFNKLPDKGFPFGWLESLKTQTNFGGSGSSLIDEWEVKIHIAKADHIDSSHTQYERIIDECDHLARRLIWQYNVTLYGSTLIATADRDIYKTLMLDSVTREPFIKKYANPPCSGVILSFTLNAPDTTDVCP